MQYGEWATYTYDTAYLASCTAFQNIALKTSKVKRVKRTSDMKDYTNAFIFEILFTYCTTYSLAAMLASYSK